MRSTGGESRRRATGARRGRRAGVRGGIPVGVLVMVAACGPAGDARREPTAFERAAAGSARAATSPSPAMGATVPATTSAAPAAAARLDVVYYYLPG
jgi:hypothetical protein